jgi:hypothetical protein
MTILSDMDILLWFRNQMIKWVEAVGGKVLDFGYAVPTKTADLVVTAPDGSRIEIEMRMLRDNQEVR